MSFRTFAPALPYARLPEDIGYQAWSADPATWQTTANIMTTGDLIIIRLDNLKRNSTMLLTGGLTLHVVSAGTLGLGNMFAAVFGYPVGGVCSRICSGEISASLAGGGFKLINNAMALDGGASFSQSVPALFAGFLIGAAWTANPTFRSISGDSSQAMSGHQNAGSDLLYSSRVATGLATMPTSFNVSAMAFSGGQTFGTAIF